MKKYTIEPKVSNTGSIHDIAGQCDRVIKFPVNGKYAVVLAAYYGGKGYTTHKTEYSVVKKTKELKGYSYEIIDVDGNKYSLDFSDRLRKI